LYQTFASPLERTGIASTIGYFDSYRVWWEESNSPQIPAGEHRDIRPFYQKGLCANHGYETGTDLITIT
jgi:hypothetical protein